MITKYVTGVCGDKIQKVEVLRETDKTVYVKSSWGINGERREAKRSYSTSYFDTWEDAYDFLLKRAERNVAKATAKLETETRKLDRVKSLKPE